MFINNLEVGPGGVMVATLVLEASAEMRVGSSPTWGTILKHIRLYFNGLQGTGV